MSTAARLFSPFVRVWIVSSQAVAHATKTTLAKLFSWARSLGRGIAENAAFFVFVSVAQLFVFHGKSIADFIFLRGKSYLMSGFDHRAIYITALLLSFSYVLVRALPSTSRVRTPIALLLAILGPVVVQALSTWPAMMVFFLQTYVLTVAAIIVIAEPVFSRSLDREFWKLFFDGVMKAIKYVLTLFTAGMAALQYLSTGLKEGPAGFLTSLFYPTTVLLISVGMLVYWLLLPAWSRVVESHLVVRSQTNSPVSSER